MNNSRFKGSGVALITPFNEDGSVDYLSFEKLINHVIDHGVDYLVVLGTTAESVTLSKEEKQLILAFVKKSTRGRVGIVLGLGGNHTAEVVHAIQSIDFSGIDGLLSVCPYYNKPSQEGIFQHYKAIANASPVPVILYNVPGRTGVNITAETTLRIAREIPNIVATKEASGNMTQIMSIIQHKPADFLVISGDDAITMPLLCLGAEGVISVVANVYPHEFSSMVKATLAGDLASAKLYHYQLLEGIHLLFVDGSPVGIKAALSIKGLVQNQLRLPLVPMQEPYFTQLEEWMKNK